MNIQTKQAGQGVINPPILLQLQQPIPPFFIAPAARVHG
jgi:hypothetical protein